MAGCLSSAGTGRFVSCCTGGYTTRLVGLLARPRRHQLYQLRRLCWGLERWTGHFSVSRFRIVEVVVVGLVVLRLPLVVLTSCGAGAIQLDLVE